MTRDWSELPQELLELIASKSDDISDHVRFGAVCTSWRSAASNCNIKQYPWILHRFDPDTGQFVFSNFSTCRLHYINVEQARGYNIEASCCGWLLLEGKGGIFLLNPLTKAQIPLPEFPKRYGRILSAHISSDPLSDDCLIVCRVVYEDETLCAESCPQIFLLCMPGDNAWSSIDPNQPEEIEEDCEIIYSEGEYLPAIYYYFLNTSRFFNVGAPQGTGYIIPYTLKYYGRFWFWSCSFFETPSGELMVIYYCNIDRDTTISRILKVDYDQREIRRVKDIGNFVVFASYSSRQCTCFHASDYPSLKRNHIYHIEEDGGMMAYDIASGRVEEFDKPDTSFRIPRFLDSFWFFPSLSKGI